MKKLTLAVLASVLTFAGFAQNTNSQTAGNDSSMYVFPAFVTGKVTFKAGGNTQQAPMNYQLQSQEIDFLQAGKPLTLTNTELIDTIYMQSRKFVPINQRFYEVLSTGPVKLLVAHTGKLAFEGKPSGYGTTSQTASSTTVSGYLGDDGRLHSLNTPPNTRMVREEQYYLQKGNDLVKIVGQKQFEKVFKGHEQAIAGFIRSNGTRFTEAADLLALTTFGNSAR